jgi:hypothetical protein
MENGHQGQSRPQANIAFFDPIHMSRTGSFVTVEKQRKRQQDEASQHVITTQHPPASSIPSRRRYVQHLSLARTALVDRATTSSEPEPHPTRTQTQPESQALHSFSRRQPSKRRTPSPLLHIFRCKVGRVDYFSFFLGRSCEECPHFLFRQLVARGGSRA